MTERPQWLEQALRELPQEQSPSRDLWPEIAQKLEAPKARSAMPLAMAASVVVACASLGFSWTIWQQQQADQLNANRAEIAELQKPYTALRASYAEQLPQLLSGLEPQTRTDVERNLQVIEKAGIDIATALEQAPNDPVLLRLLLQIREQELALYKQLQRASTVQAKAERFSPAKNAGYEQI